MRLASLTLHNWGRFKGVHHTDLSPIVHGVVARWDGDPERSNWAGKSWALAAIRFALYGDLPPGADVEDDWISRGEEQGGVTLTIDTGETVTRTRTRGKATRLSLLVGTRELHGAEAQREVERRVGLGAEDFAATVFFEQKSFARFVTARPSERHAMVRAWLGLDPLYGARDRVAAGLRSFQRQLDGAEARRAAEASRVRDLLSRCEAADEAALRVLLDEAVAREGNLLARATALEGAAAEASRRREDAQALSRLLAIQEELAGGATGQPGGKVGPPLAVLRQGHGKLVALHDVALRDVRRARGLAAGEFDGVCPLLATLSCPARAEIDGARAEHRREAERLGGELEAASRAEGEAREALRVAEAAAGAEARAVGRREALEAEARRLEPAAERARLWQARALVGGDGPDAAEARASAREVSRRVAGLEAALADLGASEQRREAAALEAAGLRAEVVAHQEALAVLLLVRRTIANQALDEIARRANALLAGAGVDLTVEVSWDREVRGQLAVACDACGAAFPSSQRVKECGACGATRGPKVLEELDLRLSSRSGAAEDLAGLAFCLAAGAWLRTQRGSGWSCICLDEPAGALDAAHRKLLAAHVASMLGPALGVTQAFVVAHDPGFCEGLPGLIVVRAGPEWSSVEVAT